ncbi:MAG: primosomal protein N' [Saprospiraceae bacterium]|nr:primosomal protein N' [Saprospiraceae bacterium]
MLMSTYADVILPLPLPRRAYTYEVPAALVERLIPGIRVEVQFGQSKLYSGLVERVHTERPDYRTKHVIAVLDDVAVASPQQLQLWDWMADYYCCTLGEVMQAALPGHLKLSSETRLVYNPDYGDNFSGLSDDEYLIAEALLLQHEISIDDARKILNKKTVFPAIQALMGRGVLSLREDLQEKFKPKKVAAVRLAEPYRSQPELLKPVFEDLQKKERQAEILIAYLALGKQRDHVLKQELLQKADVSPSSLQTLAKKGILEIYEREMSRLSGYEDEISEAGELSAAQQQALQEIRSSFGEKEVALLHGVTGSGKTRLYLELIREITSRGGQVLYLLPEIALTTQLVGRLQRILGNDIAVYHSKINYNERVEIWRSAAAGKAVIMAARSGLFLPFQQLELIIVDEEHDASFKQFDPAPRYHARDTAIYLARLYGAKVLLGTATPSLESYYNAQSGKYALVMLDERFGGLQLPEIQPIDLREQMKKRQMQSIFATPLLEALQAALDYGEQVILFQNRRGYSPILECQTCGWTAMCRHCDVSLTYHKHSNRLQCHYCGYQTAPVSTCPACGSGKISLLSFGTEKIEDELKIFLPKARIGRMDLDTAGTKTSLSNLLNDFEEKRIDILVGTQMVTKGLDFENVGIVGVLGADQLVRFPDFRSGERAYQLLTQVAGRAGRKHKRGKVLMQAYDPAHPVLQEVLRGDFKSFMLRELNERREFHYPPFFRLIHITLRHRDAKTVHEAAAVFAKMLKAQLGERVLGPVIPHIPRVRGLYAEEIMLKLEKSATLLSEAKSLIRHSTQLMLGRQGLGRVLVAVDVDPV